MPVWRPSVVVAALLVVASLMLACDGDGTGPSPLPCTFALSTSSLAFPSGGGVQAIDVSTEAGCTWTATSGAAWLTITSGAAGAGAGAGTVVVAASANPETTVRTAMLVVAGLSVAVQQAAMEPAPCVYTLSPGAASVDAEGGTGSFAVATESHCPWSAASSAGWLRVTGSSPSAGSGTVTWEADANPDTTERQATIAVADQTFIVTQNGDVMRCTYLVSPTSFDVCMAWPVDSVSTIATEPECPWEATSGMPWITILEGRSGAGSGTVRFRGSANWDAPRTGTVMVRWPAPTAGQNVQVRQAGCYYAVTIGTFSFGAVGGSGTFGVYQQSDPISCGGPLQDACLWTAESDVPWITVTSPTPTRGDGMVNFSVAPNASGAVRTGTIRVRSETVKVTQSAS